MSTALVSICLPSLNAARFLGPRMRSILGQSYTNWELIVVDSHSDDGSWDLFRDYARVDNRIRLFQAARTGIYAGINECLQRARGEFVYIATADDTMLESCLAVLVDALEGHRDCELAACDIECIDEDGVVVPDFPGRTRLAAYLGALVDRAHVRYHPFDGILHGAGASVHLSLTQLLARRDLFGRVGQFDGRWGSVGDFEWNMRVGLVANVVHVPARLATWRRHPGQATGTSTPARYWQAISDMTGQAVARARRVSNGTLSNHLTARRLRTTAEYRLFVARRAEAPSANARLGILWRAAFRRPDVIVRFLRWRFRQPHWREAVDMALLGRLVKLACPRPWYRLVDLGLPRSGQERANDDHVPLTGFGF